MWLPLVMTSTPFPSSSSAKLGVRNKAWNKRSSTSANANRAIHHTGGETVCDVLLVGGGVPGIEVRWYRLRAAEAAVSTDDDGQVPAESLPVIGRTECNPAPALPADRAWTFFVAHGGQRTDRRALR